MRIKAFNNIIYMIVWSSKRKIELKDIPSNTTDEFTIQ